MQKADKLVLFTNGFPCGENEPFIINEFQILRKKFSKNLFVPLKFGEVTQIGVDASTEVVDINKFKSQLTENQILFRNFLTILKINFLEILSSHKRCVFIRHIREYNSYLLQCIVKSEAIAEMAKQKNVNDALFYSFWMSEFALALAVLKDRKIIKRFIFRANGFDLYEDQAKHNYLPFRSFIYTKADKMFAVSKKGSEFMKSFKINSNHITFSYFGTKDLGISVFDPGSIFTILTSSDLRKIKRVHLMIDILKYIPFPVRWIHHGDKGDAENIFYDKLKEKPGHVEFEIFPWKAHHDEFLSFVKNNQINLYILLSETEGLPVSLIEVSSLGIPILSTNVGGVSEIVNKDNGILIPKDFDPRVVAQQISEFAKSRMNTQTFRTSVRRTWEERFTMEKNYEEFYNRIIS